MKAAPAKITMLAMRHMSGEISGASGTSVSALASVRSCSLSFLRSSDFVEAVLTYFSDKLKMREEKLVDPQKLVDPPALLLLHIASLLRPRDNIFYPILFHQ